MDLLKQNYIKYALIMTGVIIACLVYMHLTGNYNDFSSKSPVETIILIGAPLVIWFLGIRAKKKELKGKLTFEQGFKEGFKMSLAFAIISPFVFLVYYLVFNPGIVISVGDAYGIMNAPFVIIIAYDLVVQFLASLIGGTVYGAIISFLIRSK